jgi:hypothetical protein
VCCEAGSILNARRRTNGGVGRRGGVERLARMRAASYVGGLTPQQVAASTKYINGWKLK